MQRADDSAPALSSRRQLEQLLGLHDDDADDQSGSGSHSEEGSGSSELTGSDGGSGSSDRAGSDGAGSSGDGLDDRRQRSGGARRRHGSSAAPATLDRSRPLLLSFSDESELEDSRGGGSSARAGVRRPPLRLSAPLRAGQALPVGRALDAPAVLRPHSSLGGDPTHSDMEGELALRAQAARARVAHVARENDALEGAVLSAALALTAPRPALAVGDGRASQRAQLASASAGDGAGGATAAAAATSPALPGQQSHAMATLVDLAGQLSAPPAVRESSFEGLLAQMDDLRGAGIPDDAVPETHKYRPPELGPGFTLAGAPDSIQTGAAAVRALRLRNTLLTAQRLALQAGGGGGGDGVLVAGGPRRPLTPQARQLAVDRARAIEAALRAQLMHLEMDAEQADEVTASTLMSTHRRVTRALKANRRALVDALTVHEEGGISSGDGGGGGAVGEAVVVLDVASASVSASAGGSGVEGVPAEAEAELDPTMTAPPSHRPTAATMTRSVGSGGVGDGGFAIDVDTTRQATAAAAPVLAGSAGGDGVVRPGGAPWQQQRGGGGNVIDAHSLAVSSSSSGGAAPSLLDAPLPSSVREDGGRIPPLVTPQLSSFREGDFADDGDVSPAVAAAAASARAPGHAGSCCLPGAAPAPPPPPPSGTGSSQRTYAVRRSAVTLTSRTSMGAPAGYKPASRMSRRPSTASSTRPTCACTRTCRRDGGAPPAGVGGLINSLSLAPRSAASCACARAARLGLDASAAATSLHPRKPAGTSERDTAASSSASLSESSPAGERRASAPPPMRAARARASSASTVSIRYLASASPSSSPPTAMAASSAAALAASSASTCASVAGVGRRLSTCRAASSPASTSCSVPTPV